MPTTGTWTLGDVVMQSGSANGEFAGWKRLTTGSANVLGTDWLYFGNYPFNNTGASSDLVLAVGQTAYLDVTASTSTALKIATGDNQLYEMQLQMVGNGNTSGYTILAPNNTSYVNFIYHTGVVETGGGAAYLGDYQNGFPLCRNGDIRQSKVTISTKTVSKNVTYTGAAYFSATAVYWASAIANWMNAASSGAGVTDTTTAWTSLGTVTFPVAATGRIYVRRLA